MNEENIIKIEELKNNQVEIPVYLLCEYKQVTGAKVNIFDLNLEELIFEKMYLMFEKLNPSKKNLQKCKIKYEDKRNELLRTVDFKAELGITTKPTKEDKESVMSPLLHTHKKSITEYEDKITFYTDKITILNDLIRSKRLELKIDAELE